MPDRHQPAQPFFTDRRIALILRWWAAGAVYFFIGWGTALGNQASIIDFVFSLGVIMGLFNMLIVDPGLRMAFKLAPNRPPSSLAMSQRISDYLVEIGKNILIMFIIAMIYVGINGAINAIFSLPADNISVPGEPILFGIFYVLIWVLFERLWLRIQQAVATYLQNRKKL